MVQRWVALAAMSLGSLLTLSCGGEPTPETEEVVDTTQELSDDLKYEVWIVDQSNTNGTTWGGKIGIWAGKDLESNDPASKAPAAEIDLSGATSALCLSQTGANPVRPHMLFTNSAQTHMTLSFVVSGHVVIFDARTRQPLTCIRTSVGSTGARQVHAAIPAPDDSYLMVANQNGKLLERIDTNYTTNTFTLNPAATINLATCTTPNGAPCELAGLRNDNAPICPIIEFTSTYGYVTMRGGGLFVVNGKTTPMQIVAEYDVNTVNPNGCLGAQKGSTMYISSGGGQPGNLEQMDLYAFPTTGFSPSNPPNTPSRTVVFSDNDPLRDRDGHGATLTKKGKYLWFFDRTNGNAEIFKTKNNSHVGTFSFRGTSISADPAPDLGELSPNGKFMYVSMRGAVPLSGDPHASTGDAPGIGVVKLKQDGRSGEFKAVVRVSNIDSSNVDRADAHAIELRLTSTGHSGHDGHGHGHGCDNDHDDD
jgi:hypothetical protein